ncbi:MAG TPA: hypothetical protein ENG51_01155 [Deltaproteobacteria bacterium]|nr:hypothetical protein [Deltaproteobacteria bacterium]
MRINAFVCAFKEGRNIVFKCERHGILNEAGCSHISTDEMDDIRRFLVRSPRRVEENRPNRELVCEVESPHLNGTYHIYRLSDGSYQCDCLAFLFQRGVSPVSSNGKTFAACRHIHEYLVRNRHLDSQSGNELPRPSLWQKLLMAQMGIIPHPALSNDQCYFLLSDLLKKEGLNYSELRKELQLKDYLNFLPLYAFGVEFEGFGITGQMLAERLTEAGLRTEVEGYNHINKSYFKIVPDASLRGERPFELVTPKLFGVEGFKKIRTLCQVVRQNGGNVNRSCGLHIHVDTWRWSVHEVKELVRIWSKIETEVIWYLVPPSRRSNSYCKQLSGSSLEQKILRMHRISSLASSCFRRCDRYYSLNLMAFRRHGTVEFRIWSGSFNADKVISQIVFCLMLCNAVRKGVKAEQVKPTFEGVMDAIGMNDKGIPIVRRARQYLKGRYEHFRNEAGQERIAAQG